MSEAQGGCLCGNVRYEVSKQPDRITMCHCKFCQRATGGPYMIQPAFVECDFEVTQGETKVYTHVSEGSGKKIYINFCETCGTKVFQTFERFDGAVGVFRGTLDDPNWINITSDNSKHIFLDAAQNESIVPAHTPLYKEHAMRNDGSPIDAIMLDAPKKIGDF